MADFRKWFPVLAVASLMFGAAASANAQPAFSCSTNAGVPPIVRAEGLTELVGDLILNCTGGVPTAAGAAVPQVNFQIFLNTNVTSRLLTSSGNWSEALLMIDEPAGTLTGPGNLNYCSNNATSTSVAGAGCTAVGVGTPGGISYLTGVTPNVYQGRQSGANSLVWLGVPIDPPGTTATRIIRITNVRANANQLGVSSTLIPTQIVMFVSATSTTSIPINNPQQTVAFIQPGMSFSTRTIGGSAGSNYLQCVSNNSGAATSTTSTLSGGGRHVLRFTEGFASAFKSRGFRGNLGGSSPTPNGNSDVSPTPESQNTPNNNYFAETGFYNTSTPTVTGTQGGVTNGVLGAGLSTQGTRLRAVFTNVPAGVVLYASAYGVTSNTDPILTGFSTATSSATPNAGSPVRLVSTNGDGAGAFTAVSATTTITQNSFSVPAAQVSLSSGSGTAVWEVMNHNPFSTETVEVLVAVSYVANTSSNLPGVGTASVAGSFAPLSTVTTASTTDLQPRFANTGSAVTLFNIIPCSTNILFPFLTNQVGFDSGIAIANTSTDPFGTAPQAGTCTMNYYGETTGGGAAPAAQTSQVIPSGRTLTATLSSGGNYGVAATPGFQGYMIAQCRFQYGHGFAYISDVGANRIAEAYLALVMDAALGTRTGVSSETLGH
ncbi:MAG: hypothetical protein INH43_03495 [Acidobacteriaceae bacterium]|nr:hypothetical protein [Acidobacteriaceae bacterium]